MSATSLKYTGAPDIELTSTFLIFSTSVNSPDTLKVLCISSMVTAPPETIRFSDETARSISPMVS